MEERIEQHLGEPGLLVLDITAADEPTAQAAMTELDALWMTSGVARVRRVPGEPGVRARVYAALRRPAGVEDTAQVGPESEAKFGFRTADVARLHADHERLHGLFPSPR
ncbi:DUF6207 family protein [Streptomyces sp. NRRL S-1448]|uniref:DUF6207 family protein n=1 Tax=Streptomyces sp. NRRL S-1448 TaxID=1463883 RepID=UPI0007C47D7A|nr:DUF6207 family protein [Streptomyces sp. NRRL S-1448]